MNKTIEALMPTNDEILAREHKLKTKELRRSIALSPAALEYVKWHSDTGITDFFINELFDFADKFIEIEDKR